MLKNIFLFIFLISCSSSPQKEGGESSPQKKKRLLVQNFEYFENKNVKQIAFAISSSLTNGLYRKNEFEVIGPNEKANAYKMIKEKQLFGENFNAEEIINKITAADLHCNGNIQAEQRNLLVNVSISDAKSGSVIKSSSIKGNLDKPITLQEQIVDNLVQNKDSKEGEVKPSEFMTKNEEAFSAYAQASEVLYTDPKKAALFLIQALKKDPNYIDALDDLGNTLYQLGQPAKAQEFLVRKKEVLEKKNLKNTIEYATTLCNLGIIHFALGEKEKAISFCKQDKEIKESIGAKNSKSYATTLQSIASLHIYNGNYVEGIGLLEQAKSIYLANGLGKTFDFADLLSSEGSAHKQKGEPEFAYSLYKQSDEIYKELGLTNTSSYAALLSNQGLLHLSKKEYKDALKKFIQDKDIQEKLGLTKTDEYAATLNNLSVIMNELGQKNKAKEFSAQAKKIKEGKK